MELVGKNLLDATAAFKILIAELATVLPKEKRYWRIVGELQELANAGLPAAKKVVANIDLSDAPETFGQLSGSQRVLVGPRGTSSKGARRSLQADPESHLKSYVGKRGPNGPLDDV